jgi:phosphoglycerol transferase
MDSPLRRPWIRFLLYALGFFLLACVRWITNSFGNPTIQQILYHLHFFRDLVSEPDRLFLVTFAVECLIAPLVLAALVVIGERGGRSLLHARTTLEGSLGIFAGHVRLVAAALPAAVLVFSAVVFGNRYSVLSYVASRFGEDGFGRLYIEPDKVHLQKRELKNLILIYVESLERTYSDKAIFGENLLEQLDAVSGTSFDSYVPAPGTGWTIGAIVGTQCGIPLQFVTRMNDVETGEHVRSFLPSATCLPDILHRFGYWNVFLGGAPLSYAGKGRFLQTHHYDEIYGYSEWLKAATALHGSNAWGIYDDDLFRVAKQKLIALHNAARPFNLTLLTLDTHHPNGLYSKSCSSEGAHEFQTIVRCVSRELADFIGSVQSEGYLEDTNIVVIGDHLAMPNPVYSKLLSSSHRTIFNKFISRASFQKSTNEIIPFDLFPTLLEYVGIEVDGQRLALGRSGIFRGSLWPQGPRPETSPEILNFSRKYDELWTEATVKSAAN